jgi:hypothetical protein
LGKGAVAHFEGLKSKLFSKKGTFDFLDFLIFVFSPVHNKTFDLRNKNAPLRLSI